MLRSIDSARCSSIVQLYSAIWRSLASLILCHPRTDGLCALHSFLDSLVACNPLRPSRPLCLICCVFFGGLGVAFPLALLVVGKDDFPLMCLVFHTQFWR